MNPTRRDFLKVSFSGAAAITIGASVPSFVSKFAFADLPASREATNENILVVVQLSGGNDGLNTVVPVGNDAYLKSRKALGIKDKLHPLNDQLALNPGMSAFKKLFDDGQLAVINGCGYPQPNRSHFRSMEIWHTADPAEFRPQGWLGHYLDHCLRGTESVLPAVNVGSQLPHALLAEHAPVPSMQSLDDFQVKTDNATRYDAELEQKIIRDLNAVRDSSPAMEFLARQSTNAILATDEVRKKVSAYKPDADYPRGLGQQLRLIAQLISGDLGTRVYYCQIGGFDTHSNQLYSHQRLLAEVADSIAAFHKDMKAKGLNEKVAVMCFSEFGRRVAENSSSGTDHGAAGPMFVSGGKIKAGIYGAYPSLTELADGDLKFTVDFRQIYTTLLQKWLNAEPSKVLKGSFDPIAFL